MQKCVGIIQVNVPISLHLHSSPYTEKTAMQISGDMTLKVAFPKCFK